MARQVSNRLNEAERVVVVAPHAIVASCISLAVSLIPSVLVVGRASSLTQAVNQARGLRPSAVVADSRLPGIERLSLLLPPARHSPRLILLAHQDCASERAQISLGCGATLRDLAVALGREEADTDGRSLKEWAPWYDTAVDTAVLELGVRELTPRESQVAWLLQRGLSNQGIAETLGIAGPTAKAHVHSILSKLGAHSRGEAVARFEERYQEEPRAVPRACTPQARRIRSVGPHEHSDRLQRDGHPLLEVDHA